MSEEPISLNSREDEQEFNILRPRTLHGFLGQKQIKDNLSVFINAALQRNDVLDHVFLSGPPGLGKTTLAVVIAHEMRSKLRITSAPALEKPKDLAGILTTLQENGIFFIDEIHRLRPAIEEILYTAMEEFSLDWVIGQGPSARTIRIPVPKFTLIGATTRPGSVSSPLHTRFGIQFRLQYYKQDEIKEILYHTASILEISLDSDAADIVAARCRGTPRVANWLIRRLRDFSQIHKSKRIHRDIAEYGLRQLGIDEHGLDERDRAILSTIVRYFRGGPVGIDTLTATLGENSETLEYYYEPYLIQQGWLRRSPRGRVATEKTYRLFNIKVPEKDRDNEATLFDEQDMNN